MICEWDEGSSEDKESSENETLTTEQKEARFQRNRRRQDKARRRNPYWHYKLLGAAYIHEMMDEESLRRKHYRMVPDHYGEIKYLPQYIVRLSSYYLLPRYKYPGPRTGVFELSRVYALCC